MKNLIIILIFLLAAGCGEEKRDYFSDACETGKENAIADAKNGKYKLLSYGLMDYEDWEFQRYYEDFVKNKYGIIIGEGGCVVSDETDCYAEKMKKIILDKFGKDIFSKATIEAKRTYEKSINTQIDTGFIFTIVEVMPEFKGGIDSFFFFLKKNIQFPKKGNGKVYASFVIEKDGSVNEIEILRSLEKEFDDEVLRVLYLMPKWTPGFHKDKEVRVRMVVPINFKREED